VWQQIIWNDEPGGNVDHIEEHDLTVDDVEEVDEDTIYPVTAYEVPER
jgi:hypothetical protein